MSVSERVLQSVKESGLVDPQAAILVMLSGGADSVALLRLLVEEKLCERVGALHVNYRLRAEADEDAEFCRRLCAELGCELEVAAPTLAAGNLQAEARKVRYELAFKLAERGGYDLIATAHTRSDQAETVLYRLVASRGRRALRGIAAKEGRLIRPLIGVSSSQVRSYCSEAGFEWREDISNRDPSFARNRLRANVFPELREINPAVEANIVATQCELADEGEVLEDVLAKALLDLGVTGSSQSVEADRLRELHPALARLVVRELAERAAQGPLQVSASQLAGVQSLGAKSGSSSLDLDKVRVLAQYGVLRFVSVESEAEIPGPIQLGVPGSCRFGQWRVESELLADWHDQHSPAGPHDQALLDSALVGLDLKVRSWQDGDRIYPLGMGGSKLLQDIFTDQKVPRALRRQLPVVEACGEVAWVAGVATSDHFKLSGKTRSAVLLTASTVTRPSD